jgi:hypothetical protein
MLLAAARLPTRPDAWQAAARITGLAAVDLHNRLSGPLPRVLLSEADPDRAAGLAEALEAQGFVILTCDPAAVPGDDERVVARSLAFGPEGVRVASERGASDLIPPGAILLLQRGVRSITKTTVTEGTERKLSLGRALLTGGLVVTESGETTEVQRSTTHEPFLLLHRRDGKPDVVLYERRLDYRPSLGPALALSSGPNFEATTAQVRAVAGDAAYDDRLGRPGFLAGIRYTSADEVDVALYLVLLAHLRGAP